MSRLTTTEKLLLVLEQTKKHGITAYEIGSNTELDSSAVHRILTGDVKKPRDRTLSIILEYIENKIVGTNIGKEAKAEDPVSEYKKNQEPRGLTVEGMIAKEVEASLNPILENLSKDIVDSRTDLDEMKDDIKKIKKSMKSILRLLTAEKD